MARDTELMRLKFKRSGQGSINTHMNLPLRNHNESRI